MSKKLTMFNHLYNWLYQADVKGDGLNERMFLILSNVLMQKQDEDYNSLLVNLIEERQDYISSDRETTALVLTHMLTSYKKDMFYSAYTWFSHFKEYHYMFGSWFNRMYRHMLGHNPEFILWYAKYIKKYGIEYFKGEDCDKEITLVLTYMATHDCEQENE